MKTKEQAIAIFDKPKSCLHCPCLLVFKLRSVCNLTGNDVNFNTEYVNNKDCPLIDYNTFVESLDFDNYK